MAPKRTPLYDEHKKNDGRIVELLDIVYLFLILYK